MKRFTKRGIILLLIAMMSVVSFGACGSDNSSSSSSDWEKDANEAGYVKKNGKWYYVGH